MHAARLLRLTAALMFVLLFGGCASIVSGTNQPVSVVSRASDNKEVIGARCTLISSKGEWYATTPGSVVVHRGYGDLAVNCLHDAYTGNLSVKSTTKPMAFGNIIFGGVIGAGIDMGTGSAYDYPDTIVVPMRSKSDAAFGPAIPTPVIPSQALPSQVPLVQVPPSPQATTAQATPPLQPPPTQAAAPQVVTAPASLPAAPQRPPISPVSATPGGTSASPVKVVGRDSFVAERLAKNESCSSQPTAVLTAKGAGFENYAVACSNGDSWAIRCEFGNCRVLR